jgi:predicted enzyme related to lactoylglutathione lyase
MAHKYPVNWFEIPATNFDRAVAFYGTVLEKELAVNHINGSDMAFFSNEPLEVSGVIIHGEGAEPSAKGVLLYLNAGDDLAVPLAKIEPAGGTIVLPKTKISDEIGYYALFLDTEGNRLALHSMH